MIAFVLGLWLAAAFAAIVLCRSSAQGDKDIGAKELGPVEFHQRVHAWMGQ